MKENYIEYAQKTFAKEALQLILDQIDLYYDDSPSISYTKYQKGDAVYLKKGTFLHGIPGGLENFDWVIQNGFIGNDFTGASEMKNKIKHSISMWNIQEDMFLRDYIKNYSGFTISYSIGRGPGSNFVSRLVPYHQFDEMTEEINNREDVWSYWGDQTKEVRFLPSLVSNKRQIAFILNMDSEYAKKIGVADVWNPSFDKEILKEFLDERYYETFLKERFHRDASTTNRESAIMFGLPIKLVEGVFIGKKLEKDENALHYIKSKLPHCYICNVDGEVIVGNQ